MKKKVFISHSKLDMDIANLICDSLEKQDIDCWIAPRDIPYGNDWAGEITKPIKSSELFVFILSVNSNNSKECPKEINIANNSHIPIVCIKTDDVMWSENYEYHLSLSQIMEYQNTLTKNKIAEIVTSIKKKICTNTSQSNITDEEYNIDSELLNFFESSGRFKKVQNAVVSNTIEIIKQKKKPNAIDSFFKLNQSTSSNTERSNKKSLFPIEKSNETHTKEFTIVDRIPSKTIVFEVYKCINSAKNSRYYIAKEIKSEAIHIDDVYIERTFYIDDPQEQGNQLIVLTLYESNILLNSGLLLGNEVTLTKSPTYAELFKATPKTHNGFLVNESCFDLSNIENNEYFFVDSKEKEFRASIDSNFIIIDPTKQEVILRNIYFDDTTNNYKVKIKLVPNRTYFAFNVIPEGSRNSFIPLSHIEIGQFYLKGNCGYPQDIEKAMEHFEKDDSPQALYELALIFLSDDFYDYETAIDYLLKAPRAVIQKLQLS